MNNKELALFSEIAQELFELEEKQPVLKPIPSDKLFETIDIALSDEPLGDDELKKVVKDIVFNTPRTSTKSFFNQLFGGRNAKAVLADLLVVLLNNSMYTYKVGGPMIGVEKEVIRNIVKLVGYGPNADGTLAPGGSMTNFMGMLMARDAIRRDARFIGMVDTLTLYTSTESHYSIPKNAAFMGVGRHNIRYIPTNKEGIMEVAILEQQVAKDMEAGLNPFMVVATSGTTVLGAFDPIDQIADVCTKYNLWLHVDAAFGGSLIFSKKHRHLLKGIERSHSFSLNAHKMLSTPLACSLIVTQNKMNLYDSFSNDAAYLYQTDGDDFNLGKTSIQCGRRNDAFKFWTLWKSIGTNGLEQMVDHELSLTKIGQDYVKNNPDYTVYSPENTLTICFNYKDIPAAKLCNDLYEKGELMIGYGSFNDEEFIRLVTVNAGNTEEDLLNFFKKLEAFVAKEY